MIIREEVIIISRRRIKRISLLFAILFSISIIIPNSFILIDNDWDRVTANPIPNKTDYVVSGTLEIFDQNFTHTGTITVSSGGHLILNNVTIYFKRDPNITSGVCTFIIEQGGKLEMYESRVGSTAGTENYLKMSFIIEGEATIKNSEIFDLGRPTDAKYGYKSGLLIYENEVIIEKSVIKNNYGNGVFIGNVTPSIRDCIVMNNRDVGVLVQGAAPSIIGSIIKNNGKGGIVVEEFDYPGGIINDCKISSNHEYGIRFYKSIASVSNCVIENIDGIGIEVDYINASSETITGNTIIESISGIALWGVDSALITNNKFENNGNHLKLSNSEGITRDNIYGTAKENKIYIDDSKFELYDGPTEPYEYENGGSNNARVWRALTALVKDEIGAPVPNVNVDILSYSDNQLFSGVSDSKGIVKGEVLIAELTGDEFRSNEPLSLIAIKEGVGTVMNIEPENLSALNITIKPLPDYNIVNFYVYAQKASGNISNNLTIDIVVTNQGASNSPPTTIVVSVEDKLLDPIAVPSLNPNSEIVVSGYWEPTSQGTFTLDAAIDPEQKVFELLESNNVFEKNIPVRADLDIIEKSIILEPLNATQGTEIKINVSITNIGLWGDGPLKAILSVDGRNIDEHSYPYLGANDTWQVSFTTEATGGDMDIEVQVRFGDEIEELDLSNNQASFTYSSIRVDKGFSWEPIYYAAIIGAAFIIGLIVFLLFYRRRRAKEEKAFVESMKFDVKTQIEYLKGRLFYSFILQNSTPHPISDIQIRPALPTGTFAPDKDVKSIPMLDTKAKETIKFELRPLGECGNREIWSAVDFYDFELKGRRTIHTKKIKAEVICPVLHVEVIKLHEFNSNISRMKVVEEVADRVPVPARRLFEVICDVLKSKNMQPLTPVLHENKKTFNGLGRFWASGVKGIKYGVTVEVVGGQEMARLILRVYSSDEKTLVGFTQAILDAVQPHLPIREHVKPKFLIEKIEGDMIIGKSISIQDSVIQRSTIGGKKR